MTSDFGLKKTNHHKMPEKTNPYIENKSLRTGSNFTPQLIVMPCMTLWCHGLPPAMAESAKFMFVTWLMTPDVSSVVTWRSTQVALLPQGCGEGCCPDLPCAQGAQLANCSPSPSKACGITYQCVMALHTQRKILVICSRCLM